MDCTRLRGSFISIQLAQGRREAGQSEKIYRGTSLKRNTLPQDPTVALCLETYDNPRGVGVSYERGTQVRINFLSWEH